MNNDHQRRKSIGFGRPEPEWADWSTRLIDDVTATALVLDVDAAVRVLECRDHSIRALATAGGIDPARHFRGLDLRGWPLAGQDVRGFDLSRCNLLDTGIEFALVDETTVLTDAIVDPAAPPGSAAVTLPDDYVEQAQAMILAGRAPPAPWIPYLTTLDFDNSELADLAPLAGLSALTTLYCSDTQVSDLAPLAGLSALTELSCFNTQVSDLAPLAGLSALTELSCSDTQVSDLAPLAGLSALTELSCFNTQVSNLAPLAGLSALTRLDCFNTQVSDLAPLAGLSALTTLDCRYAPVSDLAPLAGLDKLIVYVESDERASALRATLPADPTVTVAVPDWMRRDNRVG